MTESDGSGRIIDENGALFGRVNVVDAVVVLVVLTVLLAGTALVLDRGNSDVSNTKPTKYATVSYAVPLTSGAAAIESGETLDPAPTGEPLEVVGVTRSFAPGGEAHVVSRVAYTGPLSAQWVWGDGIVRDDTRPLYGGDETAVIANGYRTRADVLAVNQTTATLPTSRVSVVISVNESVARSVETGATARVDDHTVATVERVGDGPAADGKRAVTLELRTWARDGTPWFGGSPLRVDNRVTVVTDDAVVSGRLQRVGPANASEQ
ncbi:DUF4330 family protein [Haloarcula sp. JP-L23]|uniref:DUF4330 family protein n=1 Tax=Haloarcula sp. JP-L23 TaxID=2716717 RepID=UPI00140F4981|nr:DUF4330 family protein [Haloarcula sp. JP-L23]